MEKLISKFIDSLCAAAADDTERKVRVACLVRSRRIFLWASLPLVLALTGIAVMLALFYIPVSRGGTEATLFPKIADIFFIYTGVLLFMTVVCLGMVKAVDKMLTLLGSLRPDEDDCEDPVVAFPAPPEPAGTKEDESSTFSETGETEEDESPKFSETGETEENESPTFSENEADRQLESSRSVYESVG